MGCGVLAGLWLVLYVDCCVGIWVVVFMLLIVLRVVSVSGL